MTKVDEVNHTVTGVITDETPDKTGEICDYVKSKPYYQKWSDEIAKATGGLSVGNVREMHQLNAVGKLTKLEYNDKEKEIVGTTKVIDPLTWKKCVEGVLSGYSHGGAYVEKWEDGDHTRYVASPSEVSLVDNPANSACHFEYVKADGTTELRKFHSGDELVKPSEPATQEKVEKTEPVPYTITLTGVGSSSGTLWNPILTVPSVDLPSVFKVVKAAVTEILTKQEHCGNCGEPAFKCACGKIATVKKSSTEDESLKRVLLEKASNPATRDDLRFARTMLLILDEDIPAS